MIRLKQGDSTYPVFSPRTVAKSSLRYAVLPIIDGVSTATSVEVAEADARFMEHSDATYHNGGTFAVYGQIGTVVFESRTPAVATVDQSGNLTRVSEGIFEGVIRDDLLSLTVSLDMYDKTVPTVREYIGVVTGSVAATAIQEVDNLLAPSMTMADNGSIFSSQDHTGQIYTRNPNLWCSGVDLTCASPWNSNGGVRKAGTLVTPRHAVNAEHYPLPVGAVMRFVAADGTVHGRTIIGRKLHADRDAAVYTLDSDLPAAISPCKVLPSNFQDYMPEANMSLNRPPLLALDQQERVLMYEFVGLSWDDSASYYRPSETGDRAIFGRSATTGDSGNPLFMLVNGEPIFISVFGSSGGGVSITSDVVNITQMIVDADTQAGVSAVADATWPNAGGHYQVKEADFSAFPNYA